MPGLPRQLLLLCGVLAIPAAALLVQVQRTHDGAEELEQRGQEELALNGTEELSKPLLPMVADGHWLAEQDERKREAATRSAVRNLAERVLSAFPKDVPAIFRKPLAAKAASDFMAWRRSALHPQQRLLLDRLAELPLPAVASVKGFTDFTHQAADVLQRTGYPAASGQVRSLVPGIVSALLWHDRIEPLVVRYEKQTTRSKTDYRELAHVLRDFAAVDLSTEWPVLPLFSGMASFLNSNRQAFLDMAAVVEAKAASGQEWVPADDIFDILKIGAGKTERAAAELLFWWADMRRKDISQVKQLHNSMLMVQDMKDMGIAKLNAPLEELVHSTAVVTANDTADMRPLLPIAGLYLDKALAGMESERVRNLAVVLSWLFKERLQGPGLKDVYNAALLIHPTALALSSIDFYDAAKVVPAVADGVLWSAKMGEADAPKVFRAMAEAVRKMHTVHWKTQSMPLHTKSMADLLDHLADLIDSAKHYDPKQMQQRH